jgi:hypothetical protein
MQPDDLLQLLERERLEPQSGEPTSREGLIELKGTCFAVPHGHEQSEPLVGESMHNKAKDISRWRVEPLCVVDCHQRWRFGRGSSKHA